MGGNIAAGCQAHRPGYKPISTPATVDEQMECVAAALPAVEKLGLKFAWGLGKSYFLFSPLFFT